MNYTCDISKIYYYLDLILQRKTEINLKYLSQRNNFILSKLEQLFENKISIQDLKSFSNQYESCFDIQSSFYLTPNEVRVCCKRFFFNDKMKGDAVLFRPLQMVQLESLNYVELNEIKIEFLSRINNSSDDQCDGLSSFKVKKLDSNTK